MANWLISYRILGKFVHHVWDFDHFSIFIGDMVGTTLWLLIRSAQGSLMVQTQIDSWASEAVVGWHIWASHNRLGTWHSYRRDQLWHNTPSVVVELDGCPTPHIPGNYHPRSHGLDGPDGPNNAHVTQEPFRLEIKYPLRGGLDQSSYNIVSWGCHKGRESLMEWWSRRSLTNLQSIMFRNFWNVSNGLNGCNFVFFAAPPPYQ